jgi:antitoxin component YwqK of YwqJK toxin-antitoxin module
LGNKIEARSYSSAGNLERKEVYKYNDIRKLIDEAAYDSEDTSSLSYRQISIFNSKGSMIEKTTILQDIQSKIIAQYDENGNLISSMDYDNDSLHSKESFKYDISKRLVEKSLLFLASEYRYLGAYKITYAYDKNGNLINEEWYNKDFNLYQKFIYRYDENGNLLNASVYNTKVDILSEYVYSYGNYDLNHNWLLKTLTIKDKGETITERKIEYY